MVVAAHFALQNTNPVGAKSEGGTSKPLLPPTKNQEVKFGAVFLN